MAPRLTHGEYDTEGYWLSRFTACRQLLEAVKRHKPELLDELAAFPYRADDLFQKGDLANVVPGADHRVFPTPLTTQLRRTKAVRWLRGFAKDKELDADLVVRAFASTVALWEQDKQKKSSREWSFPTEVFDHPLFEFPDDWNPLTETLSQLDQRFAEWKGECVEELLSQGFVPSKTKLADHHFDWLARYLVVPESQRKIADASRASQQAVQSAISELAELIGLALPKRKGQPKKQANP